MSRHLFTSESVTEGYPDKICDKISDELLEKDSLSRVACETIVTTGLVYFLELSLENINLILLNVYFLRNPDSTP